MATLGYGKMYGTLIVIVALALLAVFVAKSFSPVMRLSPEPPQEFLGVQSSWSPEQRRAEQALARAYWDCARRLSRAMYVYGDRLPYDPPAAFSVDAKAFPSSVESSSSARVRYWRNLRQLWDNPKAWTHEYEWHTNWFFQGSNY